MTDADNNRRKLIVFTEVYDTHACLADRIRNPAGPPEKAIVHYGGLGREEQHKAVEAFTHDKDALVRVAKDAAGERITL